MSKRKLGDKINRGFMIIVLILGIIMVVRFTISIVKQERNPPINYPETQDDIAETANGLGISPELVNWTVDSAYVNGFFKDSEP